MTPTQHKFMKETHKNISKYHKYKIRVQKLFLDALIHQLDTIRLFDDFRERTETAFSEEFTEKNFDELAEFFDEFKKAKKDQLTEEKDGLY